MKIINKDTTFVVDVDETLIMWCKGVHFPEDAPDNSICLDYYGMMVWATPHMEHIMILQAAVARGRNVIVHSANGYKWAATVLKELRLDDLDILVMTKPIGYLDDSECQNWMGNRVYIPFKKD